MKDTVYIDINCDVGEGVGNERELLPLISSCSIACGGHFGDKDTMRETVRLAIRHKVLIGAHPSYPDKENFGRLSMDITTDELTKSIKKQLVALTSILQEENAVLHHIKPHGALYNLISVDENAAKCFIEAIKKYSENVFLYVPYNSVIEKEALKNNINIKYEAFADRSYNNDLTLVSRSFSNAVITSPNLVLEQISTLVLEGKVNTVSHLEKELKANTFCIHGDNSNSLEILKYLKTELPKKGITIG